MLTGGSFLRGGTCRSLGSCSRQASICSCLQHSATSQGIGASAEPGLEAHSLMHMTACRQIMATHCSSAAAEALQRAANSPTTGEPAAFIMA